MKKIINKKKQQIKLKNIFYQEKKLKNSYSLFSELSLKGKLYFFILLFFSIFTFLWTFFIKDNKFNFTKGISYNLFYFTCHTIITIVIILFSIFKKISRKNQQNYSICFFAVLVNSLLTSIFYNFILHPLWKEDFKLDFFTSIHTFQHIYVTFFGFTLFFLFFIPFSIRLSNKKEVIFTFLHPFIFVLTFYILIFFRNECNDEIGECFFPYPIVQCPIHFKLFGKELSLEMKRILTGKLLVLLTLFSFLFIFALFFIFIFYLKNKLNEKFFFQNRISGSLSNIRFLKLNYNQKIKKINLVDRDSEKK
ncbi:MAG: hypothetical protein Q8784_00165 [Vigna little leaf phytoplasma]|nr:hypothetical protein [Vigna little leaf phytoplasma]